MSIVNTRAAGSMPISMSISTDSSFWKEQASTRLGWWRSTATREHLLGRDVR